MSRPLSKNWRNDLGTVLNQCNEELTISSPYVSEAGIDFLLKNMSNKLKTSGNVNFITDLSPINIYQKATNPIAFQKLMENCSQIKLRHLPRLHAKVYISDYSHAIITSGNLTAGGLFKNFEYGVELTNNEDVKIVKEDIESYSLLGADVSLTEIKSYCQILEEVELSFIEKEKTTKSESKEIFNFLFQKAEEKLVHLRLSEGAPHTVFEKTILYLLKKYDSMPTTELHNHIEQIHPDLCDSTIDRVIDGKRYGKKWKHAVRTAQQHLKKKDLIILKDSNWLLLNNK